MLSSALLATPVAGAASSSVWHRLRTGDANGSVLHSGTQALYAVFGDQVIGVAARDAVHPPVTIGTPLPQLPIAAVGDPAVIVDAVLHVAGLAVSVERLVPSEAPPLVDPPTAAVRLAAVLREPRVVARLDGVRAQLPAAGLRSLMSGHPNAVLGLLGLGDGLTPVGDDVLAGWLATTSAIRQATGAVGEAVRVHAHRTSTLSAALLLDAVAGHCLPQFRALVMALATGRAVPEAVASLLAVGHTSGAGMLLGARLALAFPVTVPVPVSVSVSAPEPLRSPR